MKIDTIEKYLHELQKTMVKEMPYQIPDQNIRLAWNIAGLVGESAELHNTIHDNPDDEISLLKELGDCYWYYGAVLITLGVIKDNHILSECAEMIDAAAREKRNDFGETSAHIMIGSIYHAKSMLLIAAELTESVAKKGIFHNRGIDKGKACYLMGQYLYHLIMASGLRTQTEIWTTNIEKLREIYGESYSDEAHEDYQKSKAL